MYPHISDSLKEILNFFLGTSRIFYSVSSWKTISREKFSRATVIQTVRVSQGSTDIDVAAAAVRDPTPDPVSFSHWPRRSYALGKRERDVSLTSFNDSLHVGRLHPLVPSSEAAGWPFTILTGEARRSSPTLAPTSFALLPPCICFAACWQLSSPDVSEATFYELMHARRLIKTRHLLSYT